MSNLNFGQPTGMDSIPGNNPYRLDTSRRIVKTVAVQARATWRLNTSRKDFCFSLVQLVEREKCNSLTSSLRGLDDFLSPLVRDLGLEPRSQLRRRIYCPFLLLLAFLEPKHIFVRFRCVYHSANPLIFVNLISLLTFAILPITFNHIQSPGRQV